MSRDLPLKERRASRKKKLVACSRCPATMKRYRERAHNICKKCRGLARAARYRANRDRDAARSRSWYRANKARKDAMCKAWKAAHPLRGRRYSQRYRERVIRLSAEVESYACDCGAPHTPERRQKILRLCSDLSVSEIREAYPCLWPCERTLYRDRALLSGKQAEVAA